ncbi:Peptide-N(4)-(N-acetyl-beta-glucosaminyl)asparagine amidase [Halotydeus destructor]|nr:Peptide-N(4)-(N-acetyl-beta-glucosaminyl)asparagine amidase [Halotydeus destructor]
MDVSQELDVFLNNTLARQISASGVERELASRIKEYHLLVSQRHRKSNVVDQVKAIVPWQKMTIDAVQESFRRKQLKTEDALGVSDLLLAELTAWFKNEFFRWFDTGICSSQNCVNHGQKMRFIGRSARLFNGDMTSVESYQCVSCSQQFHFPRFNDPEQLLQSRKGRCGEWANAFTCICSALGFKARIVIDWTDHVWTEVYSDTLKRWLHVDPCENAIDTPLMYEVGWKKSLTYCIAIRPNEVQDVTWRYTCNPQRVLERRRASEAWLVNLITNCNTILSSKMTTVERETLLYTKVNELAQLLWLPGQVRNISESETAGRSSGSLQWRVSRGETKSTQNESGYVFAVDEYFKDNSFSLTYDVVKDEYEYGSRVVKNWRACLFESDNVFKKVERDWNMTYLARCETSLPEQVGRLTWKFQFSQSLRNFKSLEVLLDAALYETAVIDLELRLNSPSSSKTKKLKCSFKNVISKDDLGEIESIALTASLSGGTGDVAWQKAQLFRQSTLSTSHQPGLQIKIYF